jgi:hypothetical protein
MVEDTDADKSDELGEITLSGDEREEGEVSSVAAFWDTDDDAVGVAEVTTVAGGSVIVSATVTGVDVFSDFGVVVAVVSLNTVVVAVSEVVVVSAAGRFVVDSVDVADDDDDDDDDVTVGAEVDVAVEVEVEVDADAEVDIDEESVAVVLELVADEVEDPVDDALDAVSYPE